MNCDRRTLLRGLAGATVGGVAGLAGCSGNGGASTESGEGDGSANGNKNGNGNGEGEPRSGNRGADGPTPTPTATGTPTVSNPDTSTETGTAAGTPTVPEEGRLVLERIEGAPEVPLTVYRPEMREMLRSAATTDGVVRTTAKATVNNPQPALPIYDAVELVDQTGGANGVYRVEAEGGTYYEMGLDVSEVSDPSGDPTPVSALSPDRRELLTSAIRGEYVSVSPETRRGEWVREKVFGHVFEHDGATYRITETDVTDAAFFSQEVWYILSLTPVDGSGTGGNGTVGTEGGDAVEPVTLRLRDVDDDVRRTLDELVSTGTYRYAPERATSEGDVSAAVRAFATRAEGILAHVGAMSVGLER